jgi:exonuclease VII large subunit
MKNEMGNVRSQINTFLGREFDAPLQIGALPEPDRAFLNSRDAARDLRDARGTNAALNIARIDMDEQSQLWGEDARRQEALARNNYESEIRALGQRMDSLSRAINERITTLELAEEQLDFLRQTFEETQRRYSRGLVSRVELGQARSEVSLQEIRVASADAELFGAIRRYEWFVRGLNT